MELFIALLIYFGVCSPETTTQMSLTDQTTLVESNQLLIETAIQDPLIVQAAGDLTIDRRED